MTAFVESSHQTFLKEENVNSSYANNLYQMFILLSGPKLWSLRNQIWILHSSTKKFAWFVDGLKSSTHSLPWKTSSFPKIKLWRSESKCYPPPPGNHTLVNMRWLLLLSPRHAFQGFQMIGALEHRPTILHDIFSLRIIFWDIFLVALQIFVLHLTKRDITWCLPKIL